jgi:hypothetical protein
MVVADANLKGGRMDLAARNFVALSVPKDCASYLYINDSWLNAVFVFVDIWLARADMILMRHKDARRIFVNVCLALPSSI